jgi:tetratricopeptide (TPR) repeat protein
MEHDDNPIGAVSVEGPKGLDRNGSCSNAPAAAQRSRRPGIRPTRKGVLIGVVAIACIVTAAIGFKSALRETQLREAYLSDLEAQANLHPTDGLLLAVLGARLEESGDLPEAARTLINATKLGESNPAIWQSIAADYGITGDGQDCVAALQQGEDSLGDTAPELQNSMANVRQLTQGASPADIVKAVDPGGSQGLVDAYTGGSFLNGIFEWWGRGHPEESGFATREQMVADSPNDPEALRLWGLALVKNNRAKEAMAVFQHAEALAPNSAEIRVGMGQASDAAGDYQGATDDYVQALLVRPGFVPALLGLGQANMDSSNDQTANAAFELAAKLDPASVDAWIGVGRTDSMHSYFPDAIHAFQTALRLAPDRTDFINYYAQTLNYDGQSAQAEAVERAHLAANPDDGSGHIALGAFLMTNNPTPQRLAEAESETRTGVRLLPNFFLADQQLGEILIQEGQAAAAVAPLRQADTLQPNTVSILRLLSRAYWGAGTTTLAAQTSQRAAQQAGFVQRYDLLHDEETARYMNPAYHRQLLALWMQAGNTNRAASERDIILRLETDPNGFAVKWRSDRSTLAKVLQTTPDVLFRQIQ